LKVLRSNGFEEFVRNTREASTVVIVKRGGNRAGCFLEVASQAVGCRRGFILLPEGREGRWGWSRFSGELSKVMAFLEAMRGSPSGSDTRMGVFLESLAEESTDGVGTGRAVADSSKAVFGGRVEQSNTEALLSLLRAWKGSFENVLGELDRVLTALWAGLMKFGLDRWAR
jgi:hypothetical protein